MIIDYLRGMPVRLAAAAVVAGAFAMPLPASAATVVFDEFTGAQSTVSASGAASANPVTVSETQVAPSAVSGSRDVMVQRLTGSGGSNVQISGNGFLSFNNDSETTGLAMISYGDIETPLDLDITGGGMNDRILIDVIVIDVGFSPSVSPSFVVSMELTNFGSATEDVTVTSSRTFTSDTVDDIFFVFAADFGDVSGFDFSDVDQIKLTLDATNAPSADATLDLVGSVNVPLPASALLMLSALGGIGYLGSRRRNAG